MSALFLTILCDDPEFGQEMRSTLLESHFVSIIRDVNGEKPAQPTFADAYDMLYDGENTLSDKFDTITFGIYEHGLAISRGDWDERLLTEDGRRINVSYVDLGAAVAIISFERRNPLKLYSVYAEVHLEDGDPLSMFDTIDEAINEALRCSVIDGRAYTVVTPDGDKFTVEHT